MTDSGSEVIYLTRNEFEFISVKHNFYVSFWMLTNDQNRADSIIETLTQRAAHAARVTPESTINLFRSYAQHIKNNLAVGLPTDDAMERMIAAYPLPSTLQSTPQLTL